MTITNLIRAGLLLDQTHGTGIPAVATSVTITPPITTVTRTTTIARVLLDRDLDRRLQRPGETHTEEVEEVEEVGERWGVVLQAVIGRIRANVPAEVPEAIMIGMRLRTVTAVERLLPTEDCYRGM